MRYLLTSLEKHAGVAIGGKGWDATLGEPLKRHLFQTHTYPWTLEGVIRLFSNTYIHPGKTEDPESELFVGDTPHEFYR